MRRIDTIAVHCTATYPTQLPPVDVATVRRWHKAQGWVDIGYHGLVLRDASFEPGRPVEQVGAHVKGHNTGSVAVAWCGGVDAWRQPQDNLTDEMRQTLLLVVRGWMLEFGVPVERVLGHNEFPGVHKACPVIDMGRLREELRGDNNSG